MDKAITTSDEGAGTQDSRVDAGIDQATHPSSARRSRTEVVLVYFGKIHAVGVLQTGDLPRVKLHFQISRENRNVD